jgi:D-alanyl-D-alanine carboxypeptidase/D-alanyl-D-alanine-endopeptidase (penicillin-binding protein 4)
MMKRLFFIFISLLSLHVSALNLTIPATIESKVAISIIGLDKHQIIYQHLATKPMLLASNMKILTSYMGLTKLGTQFTWSTKLVYSGTINHGILTGDVYLIGGGAPDLTSDQVLELLTKLKALGVQQVKGDFIFDENIFNQEVSSSELQAEPLASYEVDPSGLIIDGKLSYLTFNLIKQKFKLESQLTGDYQFINKIKLDRKSTDCPNLDERVKLKVLNATTIEVSANLPASCNNKTLALNLLTNQEYQQLVLSQLLAQESIAITGKLQSGKVNGIDYQLIGEVNSAPLEQILYQMNRYSDNLYAKTIFLSIGAYTSSNQQTYQQALQAYSKIYQQTKFKFAELTVENGAGLSRHEKLTAEHMTQLLQELYQLPESTVFINSLPVAGGEGSLQKLFLAYKQRLFAKSGTLNDVKAYSGYFKNRQGKIYAISFIINGIGGKQHDLQLEQFYQLINSSLKQLD